MWQALAAPLLPLLLLVLFCSISSFQHVDAFNVGSSRPSFLSSSSPSEISADCQLRGLTVEFATWLQPMNAVTNWTMAVEEGLEMSALCPNSSHSLNSADLARYPAPPPHSRVRGGGERTASELIEECPSSLQVFVDGAHGDDSNPGSEAAPLKSINAGLARIRSVRSTAATPSSSACLILRAAIYYLGTSTSLVPSAESSSRVGAIALESTDSGLTITAYPGEENAVILSGGAKLDGLRWEPMKPSATRRTLNAVNILQAPLPDDLDLAFRAANELYTANGRLIRAKYPNSDPSFQGPHTEPPHLTHPRSLSPVLSAPLPALPPVQACGLSPVDFSLALSVGFLLSRILR